MKNLVGIRFQKDGKIFTYNAGALTPSVGDYVVAETARGADLAEVILGVHGMEDDALRSEPMRLIRVATAQDIQHASENRVREREAFRICHQKIEEHKLEMKLVSVEILFDNSKILFYFTANGRIDFRALVKDLASVFKTRIELRQIGVRDEARMLGGLGPCGRQICCGAFLNDFQPVSIKMAKEQNLSLNPTKISGVCGRLMCCLKYEQDQYEQTRKRMPRAGREVITPDGPGTVSDLNIVKETVFVRIPNGDTTEIREYPLEQITRANGGQAAQGGASSAKEVPAAVPETPEKPGNQENPAIQETAEDVLTASAVSAEIMIETLEDGNGGSGIQLIGTDVEALVEEADRAGSGRRNAQNRKPGRSGPRPPRPKPAGEGEGEKKNRRARPNPQQKADRGDKPEKTEKPENTEQSDKPRGARFGQPVRRENPSRAKAAPKQENAPEQKSEPKQPAGQAQKPAKSSKSRNWADAVEKALKATDK